MSYVRKAGFDRFDDITYARVAARLTVAECIELCDISDRTWYRWLREGAPRWAIRLVESQLPTLDRFGWKRWEIRGGNLYYNELHYRYFWTPARLVLPLYNATDSDAPWQVVADNLTSIDVLRKARNDLEMLQDQDLEPILDLSTTAHNI